ncbi:MAG: very short patch repair endonuclease [Armatimonadetes bacterium]|nr:very short patch repair endonuclease [Armatimonadota bacterium]GIK31881.1 MAG: hypothetical protein BroJett009_08730 [Armatimonadota bacterium]
MYRRLNDLRETLEVRESVRRSMQANVSADTKPELRLRKALWTAGHRGYRINVRSLPGTPDVVFSRAKLAIFVHGCFWHGCSHCPRNLSPKTNAAFWRAKIEQNKERDTRTSGELERLGFQVVAVWECELAQNSGQEVIAIIRSMMNPAR